MNSVGILKSTDDLESLEDREQEPDDIKDDCGNSDSDESSKKNLIKIFFQFESHYRSYWIESNILKKLLWIKPFAIFDPLRNCL